MDYTRKKHVIYFYTIFLQWKIFQDCTYYFTKKIDGTYPTEGKITYASITCSIWDADDYRQQTCIRN